MSDDTSSISDRMEGGGGLPFLLWSFVLKIVIFDLEDAQSSGRNNMSESQKIAEIKYKLYSLIEDCDDVEILQHLFEIVANQAETPDVSPWNLLTEEQKAEVELSYKESFDPTNLVSHEEVMSEYRK